MNELRPDVIRAWRLSIEAAQIKLGEFNWPWALGLALNEIQRLQLAVKEVQAREFDKGRAKLQS